MMRFKLKYGIIFLSIVIGICVVGIIYNYEFELSPEYVDSCLISKDSNFELDNNLVWFTIRDEKYNGFFSRDIIKNYTTSFDHKFDYSKYTYIITVGHELKSLKLSFSEMKNRKLFIIPKQFVGIVTLDKKETSKIYIYKVKKIDLDCDYHDRLRNVSYENSSS